MKIVFSDVDGTLLNSEHRVSPATRAAILNLKDIPFVIVSARGPSGIYPILRRNGFHCPIIAYSGALIQDAERRLIYEKGLDRPLASEIVDFIEGSGLSATWCAYAGDEWYVRDRSDPRVAREERIVEDEAVEGTVASIPEGRAVHKLLCICAPGVIDGLQARVRARFPGVNAVKSSDILLEIMDRTVNKAASVKRYCDHLGIDVRDAVAFGDNYNDLEMLELVGHGVAMGNAPEDIRARFRHVAPDNDHDGIAAELKKLGG